MNTAYVDPASTVAINWLFLMISRLNNILYCTSNADLAGTDVGVDAEELERGEESNLLLLRASLLHSATHSISLYVL